MIKVTRRGSDVMYAQITRHLKGVNPWRHDCEETWFHFRSALVGCTLDGRLVRYRSIICFCTTNISLLNLLGEYQCRVFDPT